MPGSGPDIVAVAVLADSCTSAVAPCLSEVGSLFVGSVNTKLAVQENSAAAVFEVKAVIAHARHSLLDRSLQMRFRSRLVALGCCIGK